jgi:hypothetical protein
MLSTQENKRNGSQGLLGNHLELTTRGGKRSVRCHGRAMGRA